MLLLNLLKIILEPLLAYAAWEIICARAYSFPSIPFPVMLVISFTATLFTRQLGLPVNPDKIDADYKDGVGAYAFYMTVVGVGVYAVQWFLP